MTKCIPLTQGRVVIVDDADYDSLSRFKWQFRPMRSTHKSNGYAGRGIREGGKLRRILMHRVITGAPDGKEVDHINGDGLDNRRCNLRICDGAQNRKNKGPARGKLSRYLGVYYCHMPGVWRAACNGRYLGTFTSEVAAALAYNEAALVQHGEFARLNQVPAMAVPNMGAEQPEEVWS